MAIIKCKMCGGELTFNPGESIGTCDYCGTKQTLPKAVDENLQGLFNRANVLRMKAEFDKAAEIYEKILQASGTEAEAYWGLILCKYGIEYVEDPATYKRVPTCHRASYDAVTADDDFKMAIQYADASQKEVYEAEAKQIDEIQKGIVALAQKEDPYDVFICYKETDESGQRTQDSVIANDIYYQLTQEGFKVFYAAITLEDKLGQEYEPYIFSALNSSKVMLSIGTKSEYFNAVWVKNEWSRFLKIMKKDRAKMLIPCYRDMDAYELPEEFAHLQAQDMSKIGFINDLVRGIKKVVVKEQPAVNTPTPEATIATQSQVVNSNVQALLDRGMMALEDREWEKADGFFEEVLNQDAKNGEAYLGKLLLENRCSDLTQLSWKILAEYRDKVEKERVVACQRASDYIEQKVAEYEVKGYLDGDRIRNLYDYNITLTYESALSCREKQKEKQLKDIQKDKLFVRVQQYAVGECKQKFDDFMKSIIDELDTRIQNAVEEDKKSEAQVAEEYKRHIKLQDEQVKEFNKNANELRERKYQELCVGLEKANSSIDVGGILRELEKLNGYKDVEEKIAECERKIKVAESLEKRKKKRFAIGLAGIVAVIGIVLLITNVFIPMKKYGDATQLMKEEKYEEACKIFAELGDFKDAKAKRTLSNELNDKEKRYVELLKNIDEKNYSSALELGDFLGNYKDSKKKVEEISEMIYRKAVSLMESKKNKDYIAAYELFESLGGYKDSETQKKSIPLAYEQAKLAGANVGDTIVFGNYNGNTKWKVLAKEEGKILVISMNVLEDRQYNTDCYFTTWEVCSLRRWLNGKYYRSAFDGKERAAIVSTDVENGTEKSTRDKVFLLSIDEAEKYFTSDDDRKATYANGKEGLWWLRSLGINDHCAAYVGGSGNVLGNGHSMNYDGVGVRPALWLKLKS